MAVADSAIARLQKLDTSAVSDALDSLGINGVAGGIRRLWSCPAVAGRVVPVRLVPVGQGEAAPYHLGTAAIEAADSNSVIVIDNGGRTEMGSWGGLLSRAAIRQGVIGIVTDGACRDVDEAASIGFPVYGRDTTPRTARGRVVECPADPIRVGAITVHAGDLVIADGSGVAFIPIDDADRVVDLAERIVAREAVMAEALDMGLLPTDVLGADYEQLLKRLHKIG
jgi:4-hydroxy-4-methyl-2-oxoglutarate aldolase